MHKEARTTYLGIDLAWGTTAETGLVALDARGNVTDAGWCVGVTSTLAWMNAQAGTSCVAFIDAPLIVDNETGQRTCETQVGQCYGKAKVSANSSNRRSPHRAGRDLAELLVLAGWRCDDGLDGNAALNGRRFSECYPYTTLVGIEELGYDERPVYKRKPASMPVAASRDVRRKNCDELIQRLARLTTRRAALSLASHPQTRELMVTPSPTADREYKHREDLIDAVIAAWTALLWHEEGTRRMQVLGPTSRTAGQPAPTILAPCRPHQRRAR